MYRSLATGLLFFGIVMMTIGYTRMTFKCPPPQIEYRYIPNTVFEEQIYNQGVIKNFATMFNEEKKS